MGIGLFITRHNGLIDQRFDVGALAEDFKHLSLVKIYDDFFSREDYHDLLSTIKTNKLDGLVLTGYSKDFYLKTIGGAEFIQTIIRSGINPNRIGYVNIGEFISLSTDQENQNYDFQGCWSIVNAKFQIGLELTRIYNSLPAEITTEPPTPIVAIFGLNLISLVTAWHLATKGFQIEFIYEENEYDNLKQYSETIPFLTSSLFSNSKINKHSNAIISDFYGRPGKYVISLTQENMYSRDIVAGGIVVTNPKYLQQMPALHAMFKEKTHKAQPEKIRTEYIHKDIDDYDKLIYIPYAEDIPFEEINAQAKKIFANLSSLITDDLIMRIDNSCQVDISKCSACGICQRICAFRASYIIQGLSYSQVNSDRCRRCGACVAACPNEAKDLPRDTNSYYSKAITYLSRTPHLKKNLILLILCERYYHNSYIQQFIDDQIKESLNTKALILPITMKCLLRLDNQLILKAFAQGFSGIFSISCPENICRFLGGSNITRKKFESIIKIAPHRGIEPDRIKLVELMPDELGEFSQEINDFIQLIEQKKSQVECQQN